MEVEPPLFPFDKYSMFTRFKRVTAWVIRFLNKCQKHNPEPDSNNLVSSLLIPELVKAENYWLRLSQQACFPEEIKNLKAEIAIPSCSSFVPLDPFLDNFGLIRVGGRTGNSTTLYANLHPIILHGRHILTRVIIRTEHVRLLHAGPTLLTAELHRRTKKMCHLSQELCQATTSEIGTIANVACHPRFHF